MRSRALYVTVVVTAMVLVAGFAVLFLGADEAGGTIRAYRDAQGLPPPDGPGRWTLASYGYAVGVAVSVLVIVLMHRWYATGRRRGALNLALLGGIALGIVLALDGLLNLTPSGDLAGRIPSWYAPLSTVHGLVAVAVFGLAVMTLPSAAPRSVRVGVVVLKVGNLDRAARFWTRALGYRKRGSSDASPLLFSPTGDGPQLALDTDDATHLDLFVPDEATQRAETDRLVALGARRINWPDVPHVVLADPEGNLFCVVIEPQKG